MGDNCRMLVEAGALTKAKNRQNDTPADVARRNSHAAVVEFLEQRRSTIAAVHGGPGDAVLEALSDRRPVVRVEWYTIPLPGAVGLMGGLHSLLAITVGDDASSSHCYVIEKVAEGVIVSHWSDVVPNIENEPVYSLDSSNIAARRVCMRSLCDVVGKLGAYDVADSNCHHGAIAMYNACAAENAQIHQIPNQVLTLGARLLRGFRVRATYSVHSQSTASESRSLANVVASERSSDALPRA